MPVELPLKESLEQLQKTLAAHPDTRAHVAAGATERYLGRETADAQARHSLSGELQAAASYFRAKHPDLAGVLDRAVVQLAELGV